MYTIQIYDNRPGPNWAKVIKTFKRRFKYVEQAVAFAQAQTKPHQGYYLR